MSNMLFKVFHGFLPGSKTYIAGLGLIGLGAYEISNGSLDQGLAHIAQGLAMIGLKTAVAAASAKADTATTDIKTAIATK